MEMTPPKKRPGSLAVSMRPGFINPINSFSFTTRRGRSRIALYSSIRRKRCSCLKIAPAVCLFPEVDFDNNA